MFRPFLAVAGLAFCGVVAAGPSPQTSSFNVTANVPGSCTIVSTGNIAFGAYDPADVNATTPRDGTGSVAVRCTKGIAATVALNEGSNPATGSTCAAPLRQMANGTERLGYEIYADAAHTTVWGCATAAQGFTSATAAVPATLQTFGRIPAGQDVAAGSYSDVVLVDVTF